MLVGWIWAIYWSYLIAIKAFNNDIGTQMRRNPSSGNASYDDGLGNSGNGNGMGR